MGIVSLTHAQVRMTGGVKGWYATWNIPITQDLGVSLTDYSASFMAGPYLSIRAGAFAITGQYSNSITTFDMTTKSNGLFITAYDGNRKLSRQDVNLFVNYSIAPEVSVFANLKLLSYRQREAITSIYEVNITSDQKYSGTGFGAGLQVTIPFSGASPMYSFISSGAVLNNFTTEPAVFTRNGAPLSLETGTTSETESELLYFLDAGLGYRFLPSNLGGALGIRVENGKDTKTAIGPTMNLYYTF